jgi:hypothetical protein
MEEADRPLLYPRVVRDAASPDELPVEHGFVTIGFAGLVPEIMEDNGRLLPELLDPGREAARFCRSECTASAEAARRAETVAGCFSEATLPGLLGVATPDCLDFSPAIKSDTWYSSMSSALQLMASISSEVRCSAFRNTISISLLKLFSMRDNPF